MMPKSHSGDGYISDESDFFGDDNQKHEAENIANAFSKIDFHQQWSFLQRSVTAKAYTATQLLDPVVSRPSTPVPKGPRINPYEGQEDAWQLHETADEFLERVPPLNNQYLDWLWVANPYAKKADKFGDEGGNRDHPQFMKRGIELLEDFKERKARKERPRPDDLKKAILELATENGITNGKWLLFVTTDYVNTVWRTVVKATIEDRLGNGAKIAAQDKATGGPRVICIYTNDFNDREDIRRVVKELRELKCLHKDEKQSIWYKCDAYTYLSIMSGNEYGLKASLYGSADILTNRDLVVKPVDKGKRKASQASLGKFFSPERKRRAA
ncbi:DUF1917-domain-containing protein [Microthyrium microscopicum]|uniref:DUF1917-domain-containing protein n=1 Tax=Microthyrium microscopicum TaxID=703497 RepID=A0A6A6UIZ4_9PEZI|nr:DUF1917-domain-containing protein [Microthyrium microscopicum]